MDYEKDVQWLGQKSNTWIPLSEDEEKCVAGIIEVMSQSEDTRVWRDDAEKEHLTEFFTMLLYRDSLRLATEKRLLTRHRLDKLLRDPQATL